MKVEVVDVTGVEKRVEIEVPVERVDDEIEEKYGEVQRTAQVKGFRPGKVPRKMVERLFKDYVHELTAKKLVEETLETALDRKAIKPVVEPVLDAAEVKPGEPYRYTVHVEVRPEVELKEYKGLEVAHKDKQVADEDVDKILEEMRESVAIISEPAEPRPAKADDMLTAKITASENGEPVDFAGDTEQDIELWRPSWIPGLAEHLTGANVGDQVDFSVNIAEDSEAPAKFRGKQLDLTFAITAVKERTLPPIDDSLAKDNTRFESLAELKDSIKKSLMETAAEGNRTRLQESVAAALVAANPCEVPPTVLKQESVRMAMDFLRRNSGREVQPAEAERFSELFKDQARQVIQTSYLLEAVAKAENIEGTDEEVDAKLAEEAERQGLHLDKIKARMDEAAREALKMNVAFTKALDFLVEQAKVTEEAEQQDATAKEEEKE